MYWKKSTACWQASAEMPVHQALALAPPPWAPATLAETARRLTAAVTRNRMKFS
jgi:hypothetical protein